MASVNVILMSVYGLCYDTLSKNRKSDEPSREKSFGGFFHASKEMNTMPGKPKRPCRFPGCPKLTGNKDGYCDEHLRMRRKDYDRYMRGYVHHKRYGSQWRKIRARYIRKEPLCEACKANGKIELAALVHHKKPLSDGGTNDEDNLMSLCVSCHEKIHRRGKSDR